jgi:uncharacterized membrane protein
MTITHPAIENSAIENLAIENSAIENAGGGTEAGTTATRATAASRSREVVATATGLAGTLLVGAVFGFFYAYVCSAMYGLDASDPRVAIEAMQSINASVRNMVFFPAFFLTPIVLAVAAVAAGRGRSRWYFAAAAVVYALGGFALTWAYSIPMNLDLAEVEIPQSVDAAQAIWDAYSPDWQFWNLVRTIFSGISLALAGLALINLRSNRG